MVPDNNLSYSACSFFVLRTCCRERLSIEVRTMYRTVPRLIVVPRHETADALSRAFTAPRTSACAFP